ncbi:SNAP25 homologous protein SNAP33 [Morella rubra]|uniref:SNAP25 homologous protein SNAP33 n=1 Tax=Morella rubra TaxID=262757 RepID=A0A6A1VV07_9ROSI|nr:SNAP25 homologous protein SNAP33 [Morella rubra]
MSGLKRSPVKMAQHNSVHSSSNPFDRDNELSDKQKSNFSRRNVSHEPALVTPNSGTNPFDDDEGKIRTSSYLSTSAARHKYKIDFRDSGGLENQSVQDLEDYAVYKAEETTKAVNSCLKIVEDIREDATKTMVSLHQQGEQITRTHMVATDIDQDLSRGEKLLGSLGSMFSKTWKPKNTTPIKGPVIRGDNSSRRKGSHLEQKERLGFTSAAKGRPNKLNPVLPPEPTNAFQKVEVEKAKQDDALSDISTALEELKDMAIDMNSEITCQNEAFVPLDEDVEVLGRRLDDGIRRGRRLLRK